ncbi:unnamed protein product [Parajaminaea phylloscopi]
MAGAVYSTTELYRQLSHFRLNSHAVAAPVARPISPFSPVSVFSDSESEVDEDDEDDVEDWRRILGQEQSRGRTGCALEAQDPFNNFEFSEDPSRRRSSSDESSAATSLAPSSPRRSVRPKASPSQLSPSSRHERHATFREEVGQHGKAQVTRPLRPPTRPPLVSTASCPEAGRARPNLLSFPSFPRPTSSGAPDVFQANQPSLHLFPPPKHSGSDFWRLQPVKLCEPQRSHRRQDSSPLSRRNSRCPLRPEEPAPSQSTIQLAFPTAPQHIEPHSPTADDYTQASSVRGAAAGGTALAGRPPSCAMAIAAQFEDAMETCDPHASPTSVASCWATPLSGVAGDEGSPISPTGYRAPPQPDGAALAIHAVQPTELRRNSSPMVSPLINTGPSIWGHFDEGYSPRSSITGQEDWPSPELGDLKPPTGSATSSIAPCHGHMEPARADSCDLEPAIVGGLGLTTGVQSIRRQPQEQSNDGHKRQGLLAASTTVLGPRRDLVNSNARDVDDSDTDESTASPNSTLQDLPGSKRSHRGVRSGRKVQKARQRQRDKCHSPQLQLEHQAGQQAMAS